MTTERPVPAVGWRVFGLGVMALGGVGLALGDFLPGQAAPKALPDRAALACAADAFLLLAGAAVAWRRTAALGAAALTAYYALVVVVLMDAPCWSPTPANTSPTAAWPNSWRSRRPR